jgi:hypothetical protein
VISVTLQMFARALHHKGLGIPIHQMRYLDTATSQIYVETVPDASIAVKLKNVAEAFAKAWEKAA